MRDYGKVYTAFWSNQDMRDMSEDARMLALYLMTCPHGNMLGCFRLPNAYAAEDLKWELERVSKGFDELFRNGFSYRCERTFWVFINKYLEWNQFENPNVGKAAGKLFESLSAPNDVKAMLINSLELFSPVFPSDKVAAFKMLSIPFRNPFEIISKTVVVAVVVTEPEPEQKNNIIAEPEKPVDVEPVAVSPDQPAIDIAVALRADNFKDASFTHPTVQRWATDKVPLLIIKEAVAMARVQKGDERLSVNYLVNIVEKLVNPPAARASPGKPVAKSRHSGFDKIDYNEGIEDGRIT